MYSLQMGALTADQGSSVNLGVLGLHTGGLSGSCMTTHPCLSISSGAPCTDSLSSQRVLSLPGCPNCLCSLGEGIHESYKFQELPVTFLC